MRHFTRSGRCFGPLSVLGLLIILGCEPGDYRPGAWLDGEEIETPITDWAFTDPFDDCFAETATWYGIPHSVKLWCVEHAGDLYIGSTGEGRRTWEKHIARNGEGAIRVDGKIYRGTLDPVEDSALTEAILRSYVEKYASHELWESTLTDEGLLPSWRFYRLSQRG